MILNKFGSFVAGKNKIRLIPYKHHLEEHGWLVTIIAGQLEPLFYYYAVWGGDNAHAAETAYRCYLRDKGKTKELKDSLISKRDETKTKTPKKQRQYIDVREPGTKYLKNTRNKTKKGEK